MPGLPFPPSPASAVGGGQHCSQESGTWRAGAMVPELLCDRDAGVVKPPRRCKLAQGLEAWRVWCGHTLGKAGAQATEQRPWPQLQLLCGISRKPGTEVAAVGGSPLGLLINTSQ